LLFHPSPL